MFPSMMHLLATIAAVVTGGMIGVAFGMIQDLARRRNEKRQQTGELKSGWAVMPGSGARVAYLLIGLVLIQLICPLLFQDGTQWWVSGGLVVGYGWILLKGLRERRARGF
jgi:hypothetical protein